MPEELINKEKVITLIQLWEKRRLRELTQGEPRLVRYFEDACQVLIDRVKEIKV